MICLHPYRNVVYGLLTEELAFKGLIFTDALAMKGVAGNKSVCLQALQAGNDMVLAPRRLKEEMDAVLEAVEKENFRKKKLMQNVGKYSLTNIFWGWNVNRL